MSQQQVTAEGRTMRNLNAVSSVMFGIALAGYLLPWITGTSNWPVISGLDLVVGKYVMRPAETYAVLGVVAAVLGLVLPYLTEVRQVRLRTIFAGAGVLLMGLFLYSMAAVFDGVSLMTWTGTGFFLTAGALAVAFGMNLAAIMGLYRGRRPRRTPKWK